MTPDALTASGVLLCAASSGLVYFEYEGELLFFWLGAIVSGLAFGAFHLLTPGAGLDVLALGITLAGTGIGLAWIYRRRGNLLANIAGHAAFNLIAVIAIIAGVGV